MPKIHNYRMANIEIKINDLNNSNLIGVVISITENELIVISHMNVDSGNLFQTEWEFSDSITNNMSIGLESLWSYEECSGHWLVGFHIIDISEDDLKILDRIIAQSKEI